MKPLAALLLFLPCVLAQQPRVANGKLETRAVSALEKDFASIVGASASPLWVGYAVPKQPGSGDACCYNGERSGCGLEGSHSVSSGGSKSGPVQLEGASHASILFRINGRAVEKVRAFAIDCDLDLGGLTLLWLTGVTPAQSLTLLQAQSLSGSPDSVMAAIAFHAGPQADRVLEGFTAPGKPADVRHKAAFWLGAARGKPGCEILTRILREDHDEQMRDKTVFALYVNKEPQALDAIIRAAKEDSSSHVRGQAIFWLSQKAGRKAVGAIADAIANDPETEVKKKAVFALSQLPKDDGIPRLIDVARNNRNPAVRKQAFFWLGQTKDPRALAFLEEVLTR